MVTLVDAVRANTVTARQADLVYNVRVARVSGREAGRRYGMTPGQVFHTIAGRDRPAPGQRMTPRPD